MLLAAFALMALAFAGCGSDEQDPTTGSSAGAPQPVAVADEPDPDATATATAADIGSLEPLQAAQGDASLPAIRGSAGLLIDEWLSEVDGRIVGYWQQVFNNAGFEYVPPTELVFDGSVAEPRLCGGKATQRGGPHYCGADQNLYLPIRWFASVPTFRNDAGIALAVAHENGHHIQNLLGLLARRGIATIQLELQADCFAGMWASSVFEQGDLEPDDVGQFLAGIKTIGDQAGTAVDDPDAHGNPEERTAAFMRGFEGGDCPVPPVPNR